MAPWQPVAVMRDPGPGLVESTLPLVFSVSVKDRTALGALYMGWTESGGLFVPTRTTGRLGEVVYLLLELLDESVKLPLSGRIAWVSPAGAYGNRISGVGIRFDDDEVGRATNKKIQGLVAGIVLPGPTYTL